MFGGAGPNRVTAGQRRPEACGTERLSGATTVGLVCVNAARNGFDPEFRWHPRLHPPTIGP